MEQVPAQKRLFDRYTVIHLVLIAASLGLQWYGVQAGAYGFIHALLAGLGPLSLAGAVFMATVLQVLALPVMASRHALLLVAVLECVSALILWERSRRKGTTGAWGWSHWLATYRLLLFCVITGLLFGALFRGTPWVAHVAWSIAFAILWMANRRRDGPQQRRERLINGLVLALATVVSLLLAEGALRLLVVRPDLQLNATRSSHPVRFWTQAPNVASYFMPAPNLPAPYGEAVPFETNSLGLRDREYGPKQPGEFRVLLLGDSYVLGHRLRIGGSISRQMEHYLKEQTGNEHLVVINAGTGGYGPWQSASLLEEVGFALKPDVVLHGIFLGNDVDNTLLREDLSLEAYDQNWVRAHFLPGYTDAWNIVWTNRIYNASYLLWALSELAGFPKKEQFSEMLLSLRFGGDGLSLHKAPSADRSVLLELELRQWYPLLQHGFDRMIDDIVGIRDACAERRIPYLTFLIPPYPYVYYPGGRFPDPVMNTRYDLGKGMRRLKEALSTHGIASIDTTPVLRAVEAREPALIEGDGHITYAAAAAIAEQLAKALQSRLLLPGV